MGPRATVLQAQASALLPQVHAYIISYLKKEMPSVFGKENKKKQLILKLPVIFAKIQLEHHISPGDFPDCQKMQVGGRPRAGGGGGGRGQLLSASGWGLENGRGGGEFWKAPPANGSLRAWLYALGRGNEEKTPRNCGFIRMDVCFSPYSPRRWSRAGLVLYRARDKVRLCLSSPPCLASSSKIPTWYRMAAKTPAILSAIQPARRDEGEGTESYQYSLSL